ncbi:hypothetical protein BB559_005741 [Furculomyces boomerangus]|uniref:AB hydrolase-1 domain-containing protein n=2 Tax=Harpellales TaxID=61421 RepID=A0A2T9Y6X7_9FUNG|nr:hypothetical protein BB559_005741 [Furculomyces boomerangus]
MNKHIIPNILKTQGAISGHLDIPTKDGSIGKLYVEDSGESSSSIATLLCISGIGDIRMSYRTFANEYAKKNYRLIVSDIRGFGDSSHGFSEYSAEEVASDIKQIIAQKKLNDKIILVGNSLAAGSCILVASENIPSIKGVMMFGPLVHDMFSDKVVSPMTYPLLTGSWGKYLWFGFHSLLFVRKNKPEGHKEHVEHVKRNFRETDATATLGKFFRATKIDVEKSMTKVTIPTLAVYGANDWEYLSPSAERAWLDKQFEHNPLFESHMIPNAGNYPYLEAFEETAKIVDPFLQKLYLTKNNKPNNSTINDALQS